MFDCFDLHQISMTTLNSPPPRAKNLKKLLYRSNLDNLIYSFIGFLG